ncbi:MAG: hypothetical protein AAFN93_18505 [Bacteroidota bacterium]
MIILAMHDTDLAENIAEFLALTDQGPTFIVDSPDDISCLPLQEVELVIHLHNNDKTAQAASELASTLSSSNIPMLTLVNDASKFEFESTQRSVLQLPFDFDELINSIRISRAILTTN